MSVSSTIRPARNIADGAAPAPAAPIESPRLRLARLARDVAAGTPGVLALDAGDDGRFTVVSGEERINGVVCVAGAGETYDVELRLICGLVPLIALGEGVRARVREMAARARLPLGGISVHIARVAAPGEQ
jgi:hypothetical protein